MSTRFTYATYMSKFTISVFTASKRIELTAVTMNCGLGATGFLGLGAAAAAAATTTTTTTTTAIIIVVIIIIIIIIIIAKLFCSFS